jgi:hypothetical protein
MNSTITNNTFLRDAVVSSSRLRSRHHTVPGMHEMDHLELEHYRYEHQQYHHHVTTPEEEQEARVVGFTLGILAISQYALYIWKRRSYKTYQLVRVV